MTIVERIRHCGDTIAQFCVETVQWQRPTPSAMYMMLVNGLFWYTLKLYALLLCVSQRENLQERRFLPQQINAAVRTYWSCNNDIHFGFYPTLLMARAETVGR